MSYQERRHQIHSGIRKQHIQDFINNKRMLLIEAQSQDQMHDLTGEISLPELKKLAQMAQKESGLEIIVSRRYPEQLQKFLEEEYLGREEQRYATLILCNCLFLPTSVPPQQSLIDSMYNIMERGEQRAIENCLVLLGNVVTDFPQWSLLAVRDQPLIPKIVSIFTRPVPLSLTLELFVLIYRILRRGQPHPILTQLGSPLISAVIELTPIDQSVALKALECIYILSKLQIQQILPLFEQSGLILRLLFFAPHVQSPRFVILSLEIAVLAVPAITPAEFTDSIFPFLTNLAEGNFRQFGGSSHQLRLLTFRMIYLGLQQRKFTIQYLNMQPLCERMLILFSECDDAQELEELVYVFSLFLMARIRAEDIQALLRRAAALTPTNLDLLGYIQQAEFLARH